MSVYVFHWYFCNHANVLYLCLCYKFFTFLFDKYDVFLVFLLSIFMPHTKKWLPEYSCLKLVRKWFFGSMYMGGSMSIIFCLCCHILSSYYNQLVIFVLLQVLCTKMMRLKYTNKKIPPPPPKDK